MSEPQPSEPVGVAPARRIFLALPVAPEAREALEQLSAKLIKAAQFTPARLAWVPADNYHVTVHFLGRIPEPAIEALVARLPEVARRFPPFKLQFKGLGYFPHPKAPNVLWAGVSHPPRALGELYAAVTALVADLGLEAPRPDFHPHVTLARFKVLKGTGVFVRQASPLASAPIATSRVESIDLMESHLGKDGAVYERLLEARLAPEATG